MATDAGYSYYPSKYSPPLGSAGLEFTLREQPANYFFDAATARFCHVDGAAITEVHITHPWHGEPTIRVCSGHFSLTNRHGNQINGFSFGGTLALTRTDNATTGVLTSSAPIFDLSDDPEAIGRIIFTEFESLLAMRRAQAGNHLDAHYARLAKIDPFTLFTVFLNATDERLRKVVKSLPGQQHYREAIAMLDKSIAILKEAGEWPANPPFLTDVL